MEVELLDDPLNCWWYSIGRWYGFKVRMDLHNSLHPPLTDSLLDLPIFISLLKNLVLKLVTRLKSGWGEEQDLFFFKKIRD